jgi:hypothetical protein
MIGQAKCLASAKPTSESRCDEYIERALDLSLRGVESLDEFVRIQRRSFLRKSDTFVRERNLEIVMMRRLWQ